MKLKQVEIKGYRGVSKLRMDFDPTITVIIGRNGVGKTTILDAIASMLGPIQLAWPSDGYVPRATHIEIPPRDLHIGSQSAEIHVVLSTGLPSEPTLNLSSKHTAGGSDSASPDYVRFWGLIRSGTYNNVPRTLMVYYRQDRGFEGEVREYSKPESPLHAVIDTSMEGSLKAISHLEEWWDGRDADEARHVRDSDSRHRDPQLEAIRKLIKEIDGFKSISYRSTSQPRGLYFEKSDGVLIHVGSLSSGERSFIILLADLARRLQVMHPRLDLREIPGIVLIDEIELNLHPAWQSRIISTLVEVFSSCQFIITTHSPQVLSSVEARHVAMIKSNNEGMVELERPLKTKGHTSNYLLEGVFETAARFPEAKMLIKQFNAAIDRGNVEEATVLFNLLNDDIEGDSPDLLLHRKRLANLRGAQ